jgi:heat shock protein HslJ
MLAICTGCTTSRESPPVIDSAVPTTVAAPPPMAPALAEVPTGIEGIDWHWLRMISPADSLWETPARERYTLRLEAGRATGLADCNRFTGPYQVEGRLISFGAMAATRAFCGPDSLGDRYARWLGQVSSHFLRADTLFLELKFDSGTMVFVRDGQTDG